MRFTADVSREGQVLNLRANCNVNDTPGPGGDFSGQMSCLGPELQPGRCELSLDDGSGRAARCNLVGSQATVGDFHLYAIALDDLPK